MGGVKPDELTRSLAADPRNAATAWFDQLYTAAGEGAAEVPWDRGQPNVLLLEWVEREQPDTTGRTVVVGAGHGRDSEYLAGIGCPTTAFDISPAAVEQTSQWFPDSPVEYAVGDLLALPAAWRGGFTLLVIAAATTGRRPIATPSTPPHLRLLLRECPIWGFELRLRAIRKQGEAWPGGEGG